MDKDRALTTQQGAALLEKVVIGGDLKDLTPAERATYYRQVCESIGINPLTQPFQYIVLNNKLTLYARKDCTDQLRKRDAVSVTGLDAQVISDVYVVKAAARVGDRSDMATGAVSIKGLSGEPLANAMLKAETKAKRRVTLSICGLGVLDETEAESVPGAQPVQVDMKTGEVKHQTPAPIDTGHRPFAADALLAWFTSGHAKQPTAPGNNDDGFRGLVRTWLDLCFVGQNDVEQKRHSVTKYLTGKVSTKDLTAQDCRTLKVWLKPVQDSGGAWAIDSIAAQEAQRIITQVMRDAGQGELPMDDAAGDEDVPGIFDEPQGGGQ